MSAAVEAARARRSESVVRAKARFEKFLEMVRNSMRLTVRNRVRLATMHLMNRVVKNISVPVKKVTGKWGRVIVTERSKKGEFPRADTTLLMTSIMQDVRDIRGDMVEGYVGTPVGYGMKLETDPDLDRRFLVKTFEQELENMRSLVGAG